MRILGCIFRVAYFGTVKACHQPLSKPVSRSRRQAYNLLSFSGESNRFCAAAAIGYSAEKLSTSTSGCEVCRLPCVALRVEQRVRLGIRVFGRDGLEGGSPLMRKIAAELRHRELTQEVYNIGDEVAEYIEHVIEAIEDYDAELVEDCLAELAEIVEDARRDSRDVVGELIGLRQALVSGVASGSISAAADGMKRLREPEAVTVDLLEAFFPLSGPPVVVNELVHTLHERTTHTVDFLRELVEYVLEQTEAVARDLDAVSLPHLYNKVGRMAATAAHAWETTAVTAHPAFARSMRGRKPPEFLEERARIDRIVAKVAAKRARLRAASVG